MQTSVHHGKWKTSHSNVTCATTHLLQVNLTSTWKIFGFFPAHKWSSWRVEDKSFQCHLCHNTFTASQLLQQVLEKYLGFSCTQVIIMESGRHVIPMSLVPQHIYCKSTSATNNWKIYGFFIHTSVHHGEWKTSHSNVTCATTHLLQVNFCNKHLKNIWVFHANKCSSWRMENKPFKCHWTFHHD